MTIKKDFSGLKKLSKNLEELGNKKSIALDELMNDTFISNHSKYKNFEELLNSSSFTVETAEDFKAIPDDEWDSYIGKNTEFDTWENMQRTAFKYYVKGEIKKGL
ncbi:hypothetical protein [Pseudoalteromonas sp. P1-7a]|uniref:hypothetical protein n=1 Tax=Pseudoalteromonas sp. P1-7a TaxID=1723755 RepID=UPI0006D65852|nr:hypothetical protein [Pseudoalteromonas sp. P1-7a]KPZ59552.1 hypothetical protein AN389_02698 [Pseudoalteromonas sp. P1-7a]